MRTQRTFTSLAFDRLESRDVPSAFSFGFRPVTFPMPAAVSSFGGLNAAFSNGAAHRFAAFLTPTTNPYLTLLNPHVYTAPTGESMMLGGLL